MHMDLWILHMSEIVTYGNWYNYAKSKYGKKAR